LVNDVKQLMFPNTLGLILVSIPFLFAAGKQQPAVLAAQHQWLEAYNRRDDKALAGIESDDFRIVIR
jgi:triphosphoribosyl-dephospho-CoA synthetase